MKAKFFPIFVCSLIPVTTFAAPHTVSPQEIILKDGSGKEVGAARITEEKKGVSLHVEVEGLSPGEHAIHFHEKGVCTGPKFESAGPHFSPQKKEHGFDNPKGHHAGDMRNFTVDADGKAKFDLKSESVTLGKGANSLLRKGGTSLVIHASPDDYKSQPAGNAGDRIACGEIRSL